MRNGHADGRKFGHHTTLVPAAEPVIKFAEKDPRVSKIILGSIAPGLHGRHRIKIIEIKAGLQVFIQGGSSGQTLYIYTACHEDVKTDLRRVFQEAFGS